MSWTITVKAPHANPAIVKSQSGLRINGGDLLAPGSYEAKVGDSYEVDVNVSSPTAGKIAIAVYMNGVELSREEDIPIEAFGSVVRYIRGTFDKEGTYEFSMAVYYWDGSQYVKNDEYGC